MMSRTRKLDLWPIVAFVSILLTAISSIYYNEHVNVPKLKVGTCFVSPSCPTCIYKIADFNKKNKKYGLSLFINGSWMGENFLSSDTKVIDEQDLEVTLCPKTQSKVDPPSVDQN